MTVRCFLIRPTITYIRLLRRFGPSDGCPKNLPHDAHAVLDTLDHHGDPAWGDHHPHDDPRWPAAHPCGCSVRDTDSWQLCWERVWRADDGRGFAIDMDLPDIPIAPPGAMWRCPWYEDLPGWTGPDGQSLMVRTPGGDWAIDAPAPDGTKWTRMGTPPDLSVRPSILAGRRDGRWLYHGFLTDGLLVPC